MRPKRLRASLAVCAAVYVVGATGAAMAQNSTQAPPPSSSKLSGSDVEGDTSGAVRALGSADDGLKKGKPVVTIPKVGGEGPDGTGGTPKGTGR